MGVVDNYKNSDRIEQSQRASKGQRPLTLPLAEYVSA